MIYELMHKNKSVLSCDIEDDHITKILNVFHGEHAPVGTQEKTGISRKLLNYWFQRRSIPSSRDHIGEVLTKLGIQSTMELLEKAYALSLSDQYWIRPLGSNITWDEVNFFDNPFSEDLGSLLLGNNHVINSGKISLLCPDSTLDGWLRKKWKLSDGKRYLVKAGSGTNRQEPLNEKIASEFCRELQIPHIEYDVVFDQTGLPYSICEDYVTADTELVTAYAMCSLQKKPNHESDCAFYVRLCEELGIPDASRRLDEMICMDYIMANSDRHWTNFGAIRNAETLKYQEMMPLFDNGSSLWHDVPDYAIGREAVIGKMLQTTLEKHLKYVKDPSFLDFQKMQRFPEIAAEVFRTSQTMDEKRMSIICLALQQQIRSMDHYLVQSKTVVVNTQMKKVIGSSNKGVSYEPDPEERRKIQE